MPPRTSSKSATTAAPSTTAPSLAVEKTVIPSSPKKAPAAAAATKPVAAAPVKAAAVDAASAPAAAAAAVDVVVDDSSSTLDDFVAKFAALTSLLKETQAALKNLTKDYERMKKVITKTEKKRANARTNPNGFAKPTKITDALCVFLGVPVGTEMSRTDVTRNINLYIKEHNLNKPDNKRIIVPDDKLRAILGVKPSEEVSFFSLQRFLSPLFVKKAVAAA